MEVEEEVDGLKCVRERGGNENEMEQTRCQDGENDRAELREKDARKTDGERRKRRRRAQAPVALRWKQRCLQESHRKPLSKLSDMCVKFTHTCVSVFSC